MLGRPRSGSKVCEPLDRQSASSGKRLGQSRAVISAIGLCWQSGCETGHIRINSEPNSLYNQSMKISARNQLRGTVETVDLGVVTAKVGVRVGENLIESVITKQSVEELNIKVGSEVTAIIKSTEVMLMVD
jgi:molybdopterin-binding protein